MRTVLSFLLVCFFGAWLAPILNGSVDLVALKKQEDERRKKIAKSKLAVNDNNVNSVSVGDKKYGFVQMESEGSVPQEFASLEQKNQSEAEDGKKPEYWQKEKAELEERIIKLKGEIEAGQLDLNKLWTDFYIKNIPSEQAAIKAQISQLTNQIEQKRLFLSQFEAQLEELYEKARKAGIPPGWLR